jgi:hypothetical protein
MSLSKDISSPRVSHPKILENSLHLLVSFLMEDIPIDRGLNFQRSNAIIQKDSFGFIGWFNRSMDPMINGFWKALNLKARGNADED